MAAGLVAAVTALVLLLASGRGDGDYTVRAIFDTGGFMVKGTEVRVGGATVGSIEEVDVTLPGETSTYDPNGEPRSVPGKAVLVLKIDDAGFQDFRADASCEIRPQSLIGEKFVDCQPTLPRAPGSEPAPALREVPEGQRGAGQHLLPFDNNSTSVDPDLINNVNELPYAQRFRLIFNELGVSLAGRGADIAAIVERANPVLRDTNRLFGILNQQRRQLAKLADDSATILGPFSRERASVAGFFNNAGAAAEASAERGPQLEESFRKLPAFLRELRQTMGTLEEFSDAATPTFAEFDRATPALTRATEALAPFSAASTVSLRSLGAVAEATGPKLRAADPIVRKQRDLAQTGARPTTNLARFLVSTNRTEGFDGLVDLIYNSAATTNEFDQYGHFGRTLAAVIDCTDYWIATPRSGCSANFNGPGATLSSAADSAFDLYRRLYGELGAEKSGGTSATLEPLEPLPSAPTPTPAPPAPAPEAPDIDEGEGLDEPGDPDAEASSTGPRRALLDYLLGP